MAFDLDGTLIGRDLEISKRVRSAVARLTAAGAQGCIVTGRMYRAAAPFSRSLGFAAPLVCYQGAWIVDPATGAVLRDVPLEARLVQRIIGMTESDGMHLQLYRNDSYFCERRNRFSDLYARLSLVEPTIVDSLARAFSGEGATKAVIIDDPLQAQRYAEKAKASLGRLAYVTRSYPEFVEILNPAVDKGEALAYVAQRLQIPMASTAAIGDAWNDAPLLRAARFGIAMGNAPPELRARADAVVGDVAADGVAQAIEQYLMS